MRWQSCALAAALALLTGTSSARADERPREVLDEQKVVEMALRTHPSLRAANATRDAAEASERAASRARIPELTVSGRYSRLSSIPERYRTFGGSVFQQLLDSVGAHANVEIPLTDMFLTLAAAARAAGRTADAAAIEIVSTRARIVYEARSAFYIYWSRVLAVRNASELARAAEQNAVDQRNRESAGTASHNDVLSFESALDAAVVSLETVRADLAVAEANLRALLPEVREKELSVPDLPLGSETSSPSVPARTGTPPRIESLVLEVESAKESAASASLDRLPKVRLYGAVDVAAPNPRVFATTRLVAIPSWEVGVRLEWSLSQLTVGGARTEQARAQHAALVARLDEARRKLEAEREGTRGELVAAQARIERARSRVDHATALAKARRGELEAGTALPLNVVIAETDLARAKNEYVEAFVERALAYAKLDFIEGRTDTRGGAR